MRRSNECGSTRCSMGPFHATLNGPRYWVLDQVQGAGITAVGASYVFNGITMA
jgi:hypothetical protein